MLLAPLSLPPAAAPARRSSRIAPLPRPVAVRAVSPTLPAAVSPAAEAGRRRLLLLWAAAGLAILSLVPAARPGPLLGWSLPFWLVLAPLLDLAWLTRRRWPAALGVRLRKAVPRRPAARRTSLRRTAGQGGAGRSRRVRSAGPSGDRSSSS